VPGYEAVKKSTSVTLEPGETVDLFVDAECPHGKVALGGGAYSEGVGGELINDGPVFLEGTLYNIWEAFAVPHNESGKTETGTLTAVIYCANAT